MSKGSDEKSVNEMRPEYEFSGGERGKYARRFQEGTNVVVSSPTSQPRSQLPMP